METEERKLRRSELYALVWEKAVQRVAADIGVSDVAVAKACRKNHIPVPERGYWRRKEWGYKVKQAPLPALRDGSDPWITFHPTTESKDATAAAAPSPEEEFEQRPEHRIVVPETCDRLARQVRHTRAALRKHKPDVHGLLETRAKDCFRVAVAPASVNRVARILQALVDAFSARGHEVVEGDEHGPGLRVRVQDEVMSMSVMEHVKRVPHLATEKEEVIAELNQGWTPRRSEWVPTGVLVLRITNAPGHPQRAMIRDRAKDPVDQRLNSFLARLAETAKLLKVQREEAEMQRQKWATEEKAREEACVFPARVCRKSRASQTRPATAGSRPSRK